MATGFLAPFSPIGAGPTRSVGCLQLLLGLILAMVLADETMVASEGLELVPERRPQCVFGGGRRAITVTWHSRRDRPLDGERRTRLYQASSATAVWLADEPRTPLRILPGQTLVESAELTFPAVTARTQFVIQWIEASNRVIGTTEVVVYPTDVLKELEVLAGEERPGVFDPEEELKPVLKDLRVTFQDLAEAGLGTFRGRLAIVGPCRPSTRSAGGRSASAT